MSQLQTSDYEVALADDVRLQVRHLRQRSDAAGGTTLILLHEALGTISLWRDFPEKLAAATGADVLLYERRGYGGSTAEPLPRPDDYLEQEGAIWLPRLLEALQLERVVLLGHSDGGSIALIGAATVAARIQGLITIAAHTFADHLTLQGIREAVQRYRSTDLPQRLARHHGERADLVFEAWQQTWLRESFQQSLDFSHWLAAIECPALVIQGEQDEYGVPEQVSAIVDGIGQRATPVLIPDTGHAPHLERPEVVLRLVREFMNDLAGSA